MNLVVKKINESEHSSFLKSANDFSFLQLPNWAKVKTEWKHFSIGFYGSENLVGVSLVLTRAIPKINYSLWYLPEGPVLNENYLLQVEEWVRALKEFTKGKRVFAVKFGPRIIQNRFSKDEIELAIETGLKNFDAIKNEPNEAIAALKTSGCKQQSQAAGFGDFQPRFIFIKDILNKTDEALLKEFNQLWRRNIKKSESSQIVVKSGGVELLPIFHKLYEETAIRDRFTPRGFKYFEKMLENLNTEISKIRIYVAFKDEAPLAATIWIKVKNRVWYSYGASSNEGRDFKPSNAIQWQMIKDARDAGAEIYDFRGISDSLNPNNPLFGLLRFKLGTNGEAVEYIGEWDLVINKLIYRGFMLMLKYRGRK